MSSLKTLGVHHILHGCTLKEQILSVAEESVCPNKQGKGGGGGGINVANLEALLRDKELCHTFK